MPGKRLVIGLCASVALLTAACVPSEADIEDVVSYDRDTTMGRLQRDGAIVIALPADLGPYGSIDGDGDPQGFVAELAAEIAAALGVDAEYVAATGEDALEMVRGGEVDLAFPTVGITESLARQNNLSAPYWVAHKRLLAPNGSDLRSAADLGGREVCQYEEERTRIDIADLVPDADVTDVSDFEECAEALQSGSEAVTAPDVYLIALASSLGNYEIRGEQLSTSGYSAALPEDATDMRTFVNSVLTDVKSEGRWLRYYEEWLAPVANRADVNAPDLTLEEAATLWPNDLE
ncbi:MAG: transporter substrate-binding domain-containing protein [Actinomycetota bacterium]